MNTEEFMAIWDNRHFKQYVITQARRHSKNREDQEDFIQEVACYIGLAEPGLTMECYREIAYNAIQTTYKAYKKEHYYSIPYYN